jgi:hypothetical protein
VDRARRIFVSSGIREYLVVAGRRLGDHACMPDPVRDLNALSASATLGDALDNCGGLLAVVPLDLGGFGAVVTTTRAATVGTRVREN